MALGRAGKPPSPQPRCPRRRAHRRLVGVVVARPKATSRSAMGQARATAPDNRLSAEEARDAQHADPERHGLCTPIVSGVCAKMKLTMPLALA